MGGDYDSRPDTWEHIGKVRGYLVVAISNLQERSDNHDKSKLVDPEREAFDRMTPLLAGLVYGTDEYKASLAELGPALAHHYAANSHHPEHYEDGIRGMSLLDLLEMLCDWKAATERTKDGDLAKSIAFNQERFGYSDELAAILTNTASELGLIANLPTARPT
jgi:hypothetical protein